MEFIHEADWKLQAIKVTEHLSQDLFKVLSNFRKLNGKTSTPSLSLICFIKTVNVHKCESTLRSASFISRLTTRSTWGRSRPNFPFDESVLQERRSLLIGRNHWTDPRPMKQKRREKWRIKLLYVHRKRKMWDAETWLVKHTFHSCAVYPSHANKTANSSKVWGVVCWYFVFNSKGPLLLNIKTNFPLWLFSPWNQT